MIAFNILFEFEFNALNHGWCDRDNCTFHHIQGTRRYDPTHSNEAPPRPQDTEQSRASYASVLSRPQYKADSIPIQRSDHERRKQPQNTTSSRVELPAQSNFPEIMQHIQQMQAQLD